MMMIIINNALWLPNMVRRTANAKLGRWWPPRWSKFNRGQITNKSSMATKLGLKNCWFKFRMMLTFMGVKDQQRSNIVKNDLWLPNLVRRVADTNSEWWWWPLLRSRVKWLKYGKLCSMASKLGQKINDDDDDFHRGQRSTEDKCGTYFGNCMRYLWWMGGAYRAKSVHVPLRDITWFWRKMKPS